MNSSRIYDWLFSLMFIGLFVGTMWLLAACTITPAPEEVAEAESIDSTTITIAYNVRARIVYQDNMKYMIMSNWDGGVHTRNLTLDSLQVAYYKMMLGY